MWTVQSVYWRISRSNFWHYVWGCESVSCHICLSSLHMSLQCHCTCHRCACTLRCHCLSLLASKTPLKRTQVMHKTLVCCISRTVLAQPDAFLCNTNLWPSILQYTFEKIGWPIFSPTIGGYAPRRRSGPASKCLRFAKIKQTDKMNPNWPSCKPQNSLSSDKNRCRSHGVYASVSCPRIHIHIDTFYTVLKWAPKTSPCPCPSSLCTALRNTLSSTGWRWCNLWEPGITNQHNQRVREADPSQKK
jgi:hypothetical protein